jgi:iron complex transport system substrate-binding protein
MRSRRYSFFALLLSVVIGACGVRSVAPTTPLPPMSVSTGQISANPGPGVWPVTVADDAGRSVTIAAPPQRIVSASPSTSELAFAVGLGDRVVAVDKFSNYPPEAKTRTSIGSYIKPDLETIVASEPDLVLATDVHLADLVPALEARSIPVIVLAAKNIEGVFLNIELLGRISGNEQAAAKVLASLRERVAAVTQRIAGTKGVRVFYELDPTLFTAGPGSFIDDVIRRAGGINIASGATTEFPQLSAEVVIEADPEVIFLADESAGITPDAVAKREGWSSVSAVKSGRVLTIDPDIGSRPGPRVVDALEQIAAGLHPLG